MNQRIIDTPVGKLELVSNCGHLCAIRAANTQEQFGSEDPVLCEAERQLAQYFAGERKVFDLPLQLNGSDFDCSVWKQMLRISFGEIQTYGQLAALLGKPKASRAVGGACSRNPLLIVAPCHRVIAASGKLTGFAAGLPMKNALLQLEGWETEQDYVKWK